MQKISCFYLVQPFHQLFWCSIYKYIGKIHFFCSNCIEAGVDFKVIAGWLGHVDGGVLVAKTYGHLRDVHSREMAKRITFDAEAVTPDNVVPMHAKD